MPGRIVDVSSNNHPNGAAINWAAVARAGVTTALIKATEGATYVNPYYSSDRGNALAAGLDVLAYHYASFGNVDAEVAHFVAIAGQRYARILDIETSTNVAWTREFFQGLGLSSDQVCTYGSASSLGDIRAQVPSLCWPAAYGQLYPGWGVMWQFTDASTIPGIAGPCDESSWHGSQVQYDTLFSIYDAPPPVPSIPIRKAPSVFLTTQGDEVFLCSGSTAMHVVGPADLDLFANAGVPVIAISAAQFALYTQVG